MQPLTKSVLLRHVQLDIQKWAPKTATPIEKPRPEVTDDFGLNVLIYETITLGKLQREDDFS